MNSLQQQSQHPVLLRLIRFGVFALLFTPLIVQKAFLYSYTSLKAGYVLALAELIFLGFVWLIALDPQYRPRFSLVAKTFFLFVGIVIVTSLFGVDPWISFLGSASRDISGLIWIHLAMVFLVLCSVFRTKKDWVMLFVVSVCVGLFVSLVYALPSLGVEVFQHTKHGSTLGNSSFLGTYMLFELLFAVYLVLTTTHKVRLFSIAACLVFLMVLFTSTAQAAVLSFVGGVVLFGCLMLLLKGKTRTYRLIGGVSLILLFASFLTLFVLMLIPDSSVRTFVVTQTSSARFALWKIAVQAIAERPLFGWGMENFTYVFLKFYDPCFGSNACGGEIWFDRAHNQWLDLMVQTGIVGLIAYVGMMASVAKTLWKSLRLHHISAAVFSLIFAFFAAYFAQNLTVFDTATSVLLFVVLLAFIHHLFVAQTDATEKRVDSAGTGTFFFVQTLLTCVVPVTLFLFVLQPVRANHATYVVTQATEMSTRLPAYEFATTHAAIGIDERRSILAGQTWTTIWDLTDEQRIIGQALLQKELDFAKDGLSQTIASRPYELIAYLDLGMIYLTNARYYDAQDYAQAEMLLQEAINRNPQNPLSYEALAMVFLDQGKIEPALALMEDVVDLDPQVPNSQLRRLIAYLFTNDEILIQQKIEETLEALPALNKQVSALFSLHLDGNQDKLLSKFYYDIKP